MGISESGREQVNLLYRAQITMHSIYSVNLILMVISLTRSCEITIFCIYRMHPVTLTFSTFQPF